MKSTAKAILFGGFILAAQGAMADNANWPGASDDAGITLQARVTYADEHARDGSAPVQSAFARPAPDGVFLPANATYASQHAGNSRAMTASAFPGSSDDAGINVIARSTYADSHLDQSMQAYRPVQGTDTGSN